MTLELVNGYLGANTLLIFGALALTGLRRLSSRILYRQLLLTGYAITVVATRAWSICVRPSGLCFSGIQERIAW